MKKIDDGGPAYPTSPRMFRNQDGTIFNVNEFDNHPEPGMSLRDHFASHAPAYPFKLPACSSADLVSPIEKVAEAIVEWNYGYADAMLRQRAKEKQ